MLAQTPLGAYGAWSVWPAVIGVFAFVLIGAAVARFALRDRPCVGAAVGMSLYLGLVVPVLTWWWLGEARESFTALFPVLLGVAVPLSLGVAAMTWRGVKDPALRKRNFRWAGVLALPLVIPGIALFSGYGMAALAIPAVFFFESDVRRWGV